eukprot:CAMPEP_0206008802 /NCGR_PEP_ID=MMETSP1464-20131121/8293_1 /ASSEMBLY_ACC=CAM_ASM_001124 /TAXON_ID=119497 /ORGANISM="Exanthemachrysis gayraliae, Strain RCC1523" /LENGTH=87 /DNA_ID=CAMNT_0053382363 /DNA_START=331 /DNA_END=594 /DNA_ORIENTATION=-
MRRTAAGWSANRVPVRLRHPGGGGGPSSPPWHSQSRKRGLTSAGRQVSASYIGLTDAHEGARIQMLPARGGFKEGPPACLAPREHWS